MPKKHAKKEPDKEKSGSKEISHMLVDSNNFNRVLEHIDAEGRLKTPGTKIAIQCCICQDKDLAVLSPRIATQSTARQEPYAVLHCGHAFGYECLSQWLIKDINISNPTCPACRKPVFCPRNHPFVFPVRGACAPEHQHYELVQIRENLKEQVCEKCPDESVSPDHPGPRLLPSQDTMLLPASGELHLQLNLGVNSLPLQFLRLASELRLFGDIGNGTCMTEPLDPEVWHFPIRDPAAGRRARRLRQRPLVFSEAESQQIAALRLLEYESGLRHEAASLEQERIRFAEQQLEINRTNARTLERIAQAEAALDTRWRKHDRVVAMLFGSMNVDSPSGDPSAEAAVGILDEQSGDMRQGDAEQRASRWGQPEPEEQVAREGEASREGQESYDGQNGCEEALTNPESSIKRPRETEETSGDDEGGGSQKRPKTKETE
ncbi:hypothetical protein F5Y15DRAFT_376406 [Xylariaceae sp. FL0016]|nr:hypothetical protein F5Y15DRAFT_376406 [Xylariaceae sp. FL0016]